MVMWQKMRSGLNASPSFARPSAKIGLYDNTCNVPLFHSLQCLCMVGLSVLVCMGIPQLDRPWSTRGSTTQKGKIPNSQNMLYVYCLGTFLPRVPWPQFSALETLANQWVCPKLVGLFLFLAIIFFNVLCRKPLFCKNTGWFERPKSKSNICKFFFVFFLVHKIDCPQ